MYIHDYSLFVSSRSNFLTQFDSCVNYSLMINPTSSM